MTAAVTGTATPDVVAWMTAAQAGDRDAFGRVYARYLDVVFRFIYYRVGNRPVAEDLTSETFVRAIKRIDTFTWQGRDPSAWFITIARNLIADHYKSGRYRLEVSVGEPVDAADDGQGPHAAAEGAEFRAAWRDIRSRLTAEQVRCMELRYIMGLSIEEVCAEMGKEPGAVKALTYRASIAAAKLLRARAGLERPPVIPGPRRPVPPPPGPRPGSGEPRPPEQARWRCRKCGGQYDVAYRHPKACTGWLELLAPA